MKINKLSVTMLTVGLFINILGLSQVNPRLLNENYMYTVFLEDFSGTQLNSTKWNIVSGIERGIAILDDHPLTHRLLNGNLELSMFYSQNYTSGGYTKNYVGGEIITKSLYKYKYGSFECYAKFAFQNGSWPAFWIQGIDDIPCVQGGQFGNEIDIAEFQCDHPLPTIDHVVHRYYPPINCVGNESADMKDLKETQFGAVNNYHLFKCVWSSEKIQYYIDGFLKYTLPNTGQEWFPNIPLPIILSQQIIQPYNILGQMISPVTPQTSYFDYVRVKQFFLAPEITCPTIICSTGTATMDVDPQATNITWQLTPSSLFTASSGTGSTANIVRASGANGLGKITYTFYMPSGESFTADKEFWIGGPVINRISGPLYTPNYQWATYRAELESDLSLSTSYNWILSPLKGNSVYNYGNSVEIAFYNPGYYQLVVQAKNTCTGAGYGPYFVTGLYVYENRSLSISPNPTTGETTLELVSNSKESLKEDIEWSLEIYDSMQGMKEKKTKIKDKQTKVNTTNWKDGVYFVRAIIGDEIISEKLVVKH